MGVVLEDCGQRYRLLSCDLGECPLLVIMDEIRISIVLKCIVDMIRIDIVESESWRR